MALQWAGLRQQWAELRLQWAELRLQSLYPISEGSPVRAEGMVRRTECITV